MTVASVPSIDPSLHRRLDRSIEAYHVVYLRISGTHSSLVKATEEQLARVGSSDMTYEYKVSLAVEIPLIFLAVTAVSLRVFSRIGIKKQLAVDDVLIIIGTVRICEYMHE
jgi:hypothetical protein